MDPVVCTGKHSRGSHVAGEMEHGVWVFLNIGPLGIAWDPGIQERGCWEDCQIEL